jgi:hypothetical protein
LNWKFWEKKKKKAIMPVKINTITGKNLIRLFESFLQEKSSDIKRLLIHEEVISVKNGINKPRVNAGLKYENVDFFKSVKIQYPEGMSLDKIEKLRAEARDTCWKDIHQQELDFVHGYKVYTWETPWELIQEARKREAEEEAARAVERGVKLQEDLEDECIPEDLQTNGEIPSTFEDDYVLQDEEPALKGKSSMLTTEYEEISRKRMHEVEEINDVIGEMKSKPKKVVKTLDDIKKLSNDILDKEFGDPDESVAVHLTGKDLVDPDIDMGV